VPSGEKKTEAARSYEISNVGSKKTACILIIATQCWRKRCEELVTGNSWQAIHGLLELVISQKSAQQGKAGFPVSPL